MTINLPPDPNEAPRAAPAPTFPPPAPPTVAAPAGATSQPAPAAPAFPDGSRGAAYRQPYVVTRRNNSRKWMIIGAVGFTAALIVGIFLFLVVGLPLMLSGV